jgi:hypothetical protein
MPSTWRWPPADAMAHLDLVIAARAPDGAAVDREHHTIALGQRQHGHARLHPGTLFGQHEFPAGEVGVRLRQQYGDLERKDFRAVKILMQAVVIARTVAQQKRGGPRLAPGMAMGEIVAMIGGKARRMAQALLPAISDYRQMRIKRGPQLCDPARQRISEITIFALAETMPRHHHPAAEPIVSFIQGGGGVTGNVVHQPGQGSPALFVQFGRDACPILFQSCHGIRLDAFVCGPPPISCAGISGFAHDDDLRHQEL